MIADLSGVTLTVVTNIISEGVTSRDTSTIVIRPAEISAVQIVRNSFSRKIPSEHINDVSTQIIVIRVHRVEKRSKAKVRSKITKT